MIEITVDTSQFDKKLADFPGALARARSNALKYIGEHVAAYATEAFRDESLRPAPWAPRKPSKRDDGHPLLIKSGALRRSFRWKLKGDDAVVAGSDRKYSGYHQTGTKNMPARPFFPVTADGLLMPAMAEKIRADVEKAYAEELGQLGGK